MNTNNQLLFKIANERWKPIKQQILFPILGGMHNLMYSVDYTVTLMASNGLPQFLKAHVRSSSWWAKENYPKEKRSTEQTSPRLCSEEIFQNTVQDKLLTWLNSNDTLCEKSPYSEIFLSAFSRRIQTVFTQRQLCQS